MLQTAVARFRAAPRAGISFDMNTQMGLPVKKNFSRPWEKTWSTPWGLSGQSAAHSGCTRLVRGAMVAVWNQKRQPRGKAHTPYPTPLIYLCKATQNHMQAFTVSVSHIILVIKSRSTAFPWPWLFASPQPCLGLRAVSLNSSTVSAAASFQALRYCFLGCKLDVGLNLFLQGPSLLFFFTSQSKDAFGRYVVEKDDICSLLPPYTHTHTHPPSPLPPISHKTTQPS